MTGRALLIVAAAWILWIPGNTETNRLSIHTPSQGTSPGGLETPVFISPRPLDAFETRAQCLAEVVKRKGADRQTKTVYECWPAEFTPKGYHQ